MLSRGEFGCIEFKPQLGVCDQQVYLLDLDQLSNLRIRESLENQLFEVACQAFRRQPSLEFYQDVVNHLYSGELFVSEDKDNGKKMLNRRVSSEHLKLIDIVGFNHPDLNPKTLIISNHYGGQPMIENAPRPRSKHPKIRDFMDEIDYYSGDARILIGIRENSDER